MGTTERIRKLVHIIPGSEPTIVVLSAMAGVTNGLVETCQALKAGNLKMAQNLLKQVETKHSQTCNELFATKEFRRKGLEFVFREFDRSAETLKGGYSEKTERQILALGEILSTNLFYLFLQEIEINAALLPALNFMRIDKDGEPDYFYITENLSRLLDSCSGINLLITQGFICRNAQGETDNLKRGGSDYTAAIIGNAINATEVQIWTDIDGFHNNDPRYVNGTEPIRELSFDEAAELAYFGAKILHPSTINPCRVKGIPVILKNTLSPTDTGTTIGPYRVNAGIKAVAAKDGITAIRIVSQRMLMAHGFLKRVFDIFNEYKTPVDLITTSEVAITLTIDNPAHMGSICRALSEFSTVEVTENQTIICVVGDFVAEKPGIAARVLNAMVNIPIRQISYGGSSHNITLLINSNHKTSALQSLQSLVSVQSQTQPANHGNTNL